MRSKITGGETTFLFKTKILCKYDVSYYTCNETGFIQTEEPYWLDEAYSNAITKLDVGLVQRNQNMCKIVDRTLQLYFNADSVFLDYAGGYGLFTRMMRDKGFDFYNTDKFCENIFAEYHDLAQLQPNTKFELVTAFEVLEHLINPIEEIRLMFEHSDNLLFSTEIVPNKINAVDDWWYFIPETGQHISLFTIKALEEIAVDLKKHFYTDGIGVHMFTTNPLPNCPFTNDENKKEPFLIKKMRRKVNRYDRENDIILPQRTSLIDNDWKDAKLKIIL